MSEASQAVQAPALSMAEQRDLLRQGELVGSRCKDCGHAQISPMVRCPKCRGRAIERADFAKEGIVESYTIQTVASEQYLNETPFAFALIRLDDGPRVSGWIPWIAKPKDLPMGQRVRYNPSYKGGMEFEKA